MPDRRCLKGLTPGQAVHFRDLFKRADHPVALDIRVNSIGIDEDDSLDRLLAPLLPLYQAWGDVVPPAPPASAPQQQTASIATSLQNRFAEQSAQNLPPPLSFRPHSANLLQRVGAPTMPYAHPTKALSVEEAEAALAVEKRNTEGLEKRLNALIRKNRRLVMGTGN